MKLSTPNSTWLHTGHGIFAFVFALSLRLAIFLLYVYPSGYYNQPDSPDYHHCAVSLANAKGMHHVHLAEPIFWRTPGYPVFLLPFYKMLGFDIDFKQCKLAHFWIIIVQILLCSMLPLLVGALTFRLYPNKRAALLSMWWSVFHLGFVLSSTFLLSDALACIAFITYLLYLLPSITTQYNNITFERSIALAIVFLALYTWMRPNGQFMIVISLILIACSPVLSLSKKIKGSAISVVIMFFLLMPWLVRNYTLTGKVFFCPMSGAYLQTFSAPKILQRLTGKPLVKCIQSLLQPALLEWMNAVKQARENNPVVYHSKELICAKYAWPIIYQHPFWFMQDWLQEATKTTFDLYSYQLVACAKGTFFYDPPQEFLSQKLYECLFEQGLAWSIRCIAWLEFLLNNALWMLLMISFLWLVLPCIIKFYRHSIKNQIPSLYPSYWLMSAFIALSTMGMSGGFGYARLRLCIEPLFIAIGVITIFVFIDLVKKRAFVK